MRTKMFLLAGGVFALIAIGAVAHSTNSTIHGGGPVITAQPGDGFDWH